MQNYYIHIDGEQKGPFSVDQLKELGITKETMVWAEGMENWVKAGDVEALNNVLKVVPPPLNPNPPKEKEQVHSPKKIPVKSKSIFSNRFAVIGILAILIIGGFYYVSEKERQEQIQRMEMQLQEQQRIEAERAAEEQRRIRAANLKKLQAAYDQAITELRAAKIKLNDIESFHFLRTADEKEYQVQNQLEVIRELEKNVNRLKNQIEGY